MGRRRELAEVRQALSGARLVTLTGVGGVGKSRLALRVAAQARRAFADGVWWVELAGLTDPVLLPQAVAEGVGIQDQSDRDPVEVLAGSLADRQALLVIDNCEHLTPAVALLVTDLLRAAPRLRVLATSREVLGVVGEHLFAVSPLAVPGTDAVTGAELGAEAGVGVRYPGLDLFAERAAAVVSRFVITADNADAVATLCQRLDGIPLAIELAAARLRALSLEQIAQRLDDRFRLLASGNRAASPRHRTLRAAVEWSFDLCAKPERLCWARAAVFAGRFDLEAAERICAGPGLEAEVVYEAVAGLVDKSVLSAEAHPDGFRYRLLDTLRDYGLQRLRHPQEADGLAVGDEEILRARHRDYYLHLAEGFHADWFGARQLQWSARMRAERENLRAALGYCLDTPGQQRAGLRLAGALYYFWFGGEAREGRYWLERALPADPQPSPERERALAAYARVLLVQNAPAALVEPARECVELARRFGEPFYEVDALNILGLGALFCDDLQAGLALLEQAVTLASELAGPHPEAMAFAKQHLGVGRLFAGDPAAAAALAAESAAICRAHGDQWYLNYVLGFALSPALALGEVAQAAAYARESLRTCRVLHDPLTAPDAFGLLAWVAVTDGDHPRAARLLGAVDRQQREIGRDPFVGPWAERDKQCESAAREALGDSAYDTAYRRGGELDLDQAVAYALGEDRLPSRQKPDRDERPSLTRREREVAELIAQGLSNKQIAAHLVIAQRTAEAHVENILGKLGFTSRAQVAAWTAEQREAAE